MVDFGLALEQGFSGQELGKDAPDAPYVDFEVVFFCAQQKFGGAVPQRHDELRELLRPRVPRVPRHSEIRNLDLAAVVEEEIRRFEVSVHDPVRVEVLGGRDELEHERFGFRGEERLGHVFEQGLQVVFEELHYEIDTVEMENHKRNG